MSAPTAAIEGVVAHESLPTSDELLRAARVYAAAGWRVLPVYTTREGVCLCPGGVTCASPGKHPAAKNWPAAATANLAIIETWLGNGQIRNIGIVTGQGLVVIDVDGAKVREQSLSNAQ